MLLDCIQNNIVSLFFQINFYLFPFLLKHIHLKHKTCCSFQTGTFVSFPPWCLLSSVCVSIIQVTICLQKTSDPTKFEKDFHAAFVRVSASSVTRLKGTSVVLELNDERLTIFTNQTKSSCLLIKQLREPK